MVKDMVKYDDIFSDRKNRADIIADKIISGIIENDNVAKSVELHSDYLVVKIDYVIYLRDMFSRDSLDIPQVKKCLGEKICSRYNNVKSVYTTFDYDELCIKIVYYNAVEFKSELQGYRFFAEDYADNEYCIKTKRLDLNNAFPEAKPIWEIINDLDNDIDAVEDRARLFYKGSIGMWSCSALTEYYEKEGGFRKVDVISENGTTIVLLYSDSYLSSINEE